MSALITNKLMRATGGAKAKALRATVMANGNTSFSDTGVAAGAPRLVVIWVSSATNPATVTVNGLSMNTAYSSGNKLLLWRRVDTGTTLNWSITGLTTGGILTYATYVIYGCTSYIGMGTETDTFSAVSTLNLSGLSTTGKAGGVGIGFWSTYGGFAVTVTGWTVAGEYKSTDKGPQGSMYTGFGTSYILTWAMGRPSDANPNIDGTITLSGAQATTNVDVFQFTFG